MQIYDFFGTFKNTKLRLI